MADTRGTGLTLRLAGFPVNVPLSMLLGVGLIAWLWAPSFAARGSSNPALLSITFALLLFLTVVLHELAHAVVARRMGFPVLDITLSALGGYTRFRPVQSTPGKEAAIAAAGPLSTLALCAGLWLLGRVLQPDPESVAAGLLAALIWATGFVGLFNLLPGLPLDGGTLVSAGVWRITGSRGRGTIAAAWTGRVLAVLLMSSPLVLAALSGARPDTAFFLISLFIGGFLYVGASAALRQGKGELAIRGATAQAVATPATAIHAGSSVADLQPLLSPDSRGAAPVVLAYERDSAGFNRVTGVVDRAAAAAVPLQAQPGVTVGSVCRTLSDPLVTPAWQPASELIEQMRASGKDAVIVDAEGRPVGYIRGVAQ